MTQRDTFSIQSSIWTAASIILFSLHSGMGFVALALALVYFILMLLAKD